MRASSNIATSSRSCSSARRKSDLPDNWIYIHDPKVKVGRVQNFRSWSPEMLAGRDFDLPRPRIFLLRGRWALGVRRRRADRARQARDRPRSASWTRPMSTTPASCGRRRPIRSTTTPMPTISRMIRRELAHPIPTLHLVGRNGMHKYNNQDHAMMTGMLTAANIVAGEDALRCLAGQ